MEETSVGQSEQQPGPIQSLEELEGLINQNKSFEKFLDNHIQKNIRKEKEASSTELRKKYDESLAENKEISKKYDESLTENKEIRKKYDELEQRYNDMCREKSDEIASLTKTVMSSIALADNFKEMMVKYKKGGSGSYLKSKTVNWHSYNRSNHILQ